MILAAPVAVVAGLLLAGAAVLALVAAGATLVFALALGSVGTLLDWLVGLGGRPAPGT